MSTDPLQDLLERADAAAGWPTRMGDGFKDGFAERVRQRARGRAKVRRSVGALAIVAVGGVLIGFLARFPRHTQVVSHPVGPLPLNVAQLKEEVIALDSIAAAHLRAAKAIEAIRDAVPSARVDTRDVMPDVLARIDEVRNRAALALVRSADRADGDPARQTAGDESLRLAARLFPETPAGRAAAERVNGKGI